MTTRLLGRLRALPGYVRWRLTGSPLPSQEATFERWHEAYDGLLPRRRRGQIGVVVEVGGLPSTELAASLQRQSLIPASVVIIGGSPAVLPFPARQLAADTPLEVAATVAGGRATVFVTGDTVLAPHALAWLASTDADLIYGDEQVDGSESGPDSPSFKPAWSPRMLLGHDLAGRVFAVSSAVLTRLGSPAVEAHPGGGLDLLLRLSEMPLRVAHIPTILSQRTSGVPTPGEIEAVKAALERRGTDGHVSAEASGIRRVRFRPPTRRPSVKIVMPTRDRPELLRRATSGVLDSTLGVPFHLVLVDNGTRDAAALALLERLSGDSRVTVVAADEPFNFSRLVNLGAASGPEAELLLLLNNDVEVGHPDWLLQLSGWLDDPGVVGVGPKLLFPGGTVQHAGMVFGLGGIVGHVGLHEPDSLAPGGLPDVAREVACLTGACLLVRSGDFTAVGGLDEALPIDFQDVDLCLRLRRHLGGDLMYDPTYPLTHVQMGTRDPAEAGGAAAIALMRARWGRVLEEPDPHYNPHLSLDPSQRMAPIPGRRAERMARLRPRLVDHRGVARTRGTSRPDEASR